MNALRSRSAIRLLSATAAMGLLTACGASDDVKESVAQQRAAEAQIRAGGGLPAANSGLPAAPDTTGATGTTGTAPGTTGATTGGTGAAAPGTTTGTAPGTTTGTTGGTKTDTKGGGSAPANVTTNAACAAGAPAGGNGGTTAPGVTATSIKIGGTFFNGGFLDKYGQVSENAPRAYFNYINDSGGICGRKIEYVTCDTAGTADGTSGCLNKLANQDKVFAMGPSLDFNLDIVPPTLARLKLPWVGSSGLYAEEFTSPFMFPSQLRGTDVGALITQFTVQQLKLKKLGVSFLNDVAGPECTEQAKKTAAAQGGQVVDTASNGTIETSLDNQVAKLRNAGVEGVLFCNDPVNTVKFIQAAQRVGWKPVMIGGFVLADDVPLAAGTGGKGMYGFSFWDFYKADTPGVKQYRQITEYYFPQTFHHFYEQATYIGAKALVDALKAIGPNVTREALIAQMKKFTNYDTGFGLKLNFADLGKSTATGEMFKANDQLQWQQFTQRFGVSGKSGDTASGRTDLMMFAAMPANPSERRLSTRR